MRRLRWTQAVAVGVDGIEHASFLVSMASAGSPASPLSVDQLATDGQLAALAASGIPVCPTLGGAFDPALFVHMHEHVKQIMQDPWSWAGWSRRVAPRPPPGRSAHPPDLFPDFRRWWAHDPAYFGADQRIRSSRQLSSCYYRREKARGQLSGAAGERLGAAAWAIRRPEGSATAHSGDRQT
jgi:hypothetical protein